MLTKKALMLVWNSLLLFGVYVKKNAVRTILAYSTIGTQLAITILIFLYGGYLLDKKFESSPAFVVVGTLLGMGMGFYNLMKSLTGMDGLINRSRSGNSDDRDSKRRKWM